jgi:MFS family permease
MIYFSLFILFLLNLLNYTDRMIIFGVTDWVKYDFSLTDAQIGLLGSSFLVAYMVFSPLMGWCGDRFNRRHLLVIGGMLWTLATVASGLSQSYAMLLVSRMCVGVGEAAYATIAPTLISDYFPPEKRSKMLGFFYAAIPLGAALGYIIGGSAGHAWGWHSPFLLMGMAGLPVVLTALLVHEPRDRKEVRELLAERRKAASCRDYFSLSKIGSYVFATAGMALTTFTMGGLAAWMPTFVSRMHGMSLKQADFCFGVLTAVAGMVGILFGGWLAGTLLSRTRKAYFLVCGVGTALACPLAVGAFLSPSPMLAFALVFGGVMMIFMSTGPSNAILLNVVSPHMRATAFAMNIFIIHLFGDVPAPYLIGLLSDSTGGLRLAGIIASLACLPAAVAMFAGMRHIEADTARCAETEAA